MVTILNLTGTNKCAIGIPVNKITGITEVPKNVAVHGNCFVATGADGPDGEENGWYVEESYREVYVLLEQGLAL